LLPDPVGVTPNERLAARLQDLTKPPEVGDGSGRGGAQQRLELGESHFDWIEVWTVRGQVAQICAGVLDGLFHAVDFMGGQIVHDHNVAWPQFGDERLFDIGKKGVAVHRAVEDHRRNDPVVAQPSGESRGFPVSVRHGSPTSLTLERTAIEARHLRIRRRFVDEDDPRWIEFELPFEPRFARRVRRATALLGGVRRLFLRVIFRRLKNRQSVPMATATPCPFSLSRSSASVISDIAAKAERISSAWASIRCDRRSPPWRLGATSPSRRS
jgi:hypothetical protein